MHVQWWPNLCDPTDFSPPGSSVHDIFQARILEWVTISSSRGSSPPKDWTWVSCISCIGRRILLPLSHLGSLINTKGSFYLQVFNRLFSTCCLYSFQKKRKWYPEDYAYFFFKIRRENIISLEKIKGKQLGRIITRSAGETTISH